VILAPGVLRDLRSRVGSAFLPAWDQAVTLAFSGELVAHFVTRQGHDAVRFEDPAGAAYVRFGLLPVNCRSGEVPWNESFELAQAVAKRLFTNGSGEVADRLVLTVDKPRRDLGGWSRRPAVDQIEEVLRLNLEGREADA
jgi:hypothetical protein